MIKDICIILSILISLGILWHLLTLKYIQKDNVNLFIAQKRCGKSCTIVKSCFNGLKHGRDVYCNCDDISIPGIKIFDVENLGKYSIRDAQIEIDEISMWYDNRNWKKNHQNNEEFVKLLRSAGHLRLQLNLYTQDYSVDKRIRQLADSVYIGRKYLRVLTVWRKLKKEIQIKESALDAESQIVDALDFVPWWKPGSIKLTWIPKYVGYFDSFKDIYSTYGDLPFTWSNNTPIDPDQ